MNDDRRFLLAIVLSVIILIGFKYFHVTPPPPVTDAATAQSASTVDDKNIPTTTHMAEMGLKLRDRATVLKESPRVPIETPELSGSINLKGALIDDVQLVKYREGVPLDAPHITLLSPSGSASPYTAYYSEFGWLGVASTSGNSTTAPALPTEDTIWKSDGAALTPKHPVKLTWDNSAGLLFERTIAVDEHFMFTVTDHVHNNTSNTLKLYPFASVARQGDPTSSSRSKSNVVHEGPLGVIDGKLQEIKYAKLVKDKKETSSGTGGWVGITDKYWLVALIPPQSENVNVGFLYNGPEKFVADEAHFQVDFLGAEETLAAGGSLDHSTLFFAGAKAVHILDDYSQRYDIPRFDRAIDFGLFYFLTRPFLFVLEYLGAHLGSFGIAILLFTVMLKLITLPLSLKSYHAMSKMKALQPEMKRIQDKYADDKAKQGQEMMAFYAREKVSPMAGCLPTVIQIPIFFALYKVLYVSIELRQAPFFGWIKDMSVPDPTSVFTAFGAIPWTPPGVMQIGVWPILMGLSMFLQQRLSPQPPDKSQAQMFMFMPLIFTFMLGQMPAGLVIYWTWSNLLGIAQQWYIMRQDAKRKLQMQ